jgi:multiple sugar transport system permease protein
MEWTVAVSRGILLFGLCFLILQPLLSKISISFMAERELYDSTVINVPREPTLDNYRLVSYLMTYSKAVVNSLWVSALVALLQTFAATLVGYGFARFKFPFQRLLFGLVLFTIVIPPQTLLTSLYLYFRYFDLFGLMTFLTGGPVNMLNTIYPYLLMVSGCMGLKSGLYIYLLRQFFRGMPKELEEAAYVDGSGAFRTFSVIMLPDALPMVTSCFLFAFVWQWTDAFYATLFFRNVTLVSVSLASLTEVFRNYWVRGMGNAGLPAPSLLQVMQSTGTLMTVGPILLIYLFAQRGFVESVSKSGIKG